jgi:hypothetical protein
MATSVTAGVNEIVISVDNPNRDDLGGLYVWRSTVNGFTPGSGNLVYAGPDLQLSLKGLTAGVTQYVKLALFSQIDPTDYNVSSQFTVTPTAPTVSADDITVGTMRGSHVFAGSHGTKGSTLSASALAGAATLTLQNTVDFPASGTAIIFSSTGASDYDSITYTGKTGTTLTGCSGVLAHSAGEVIIPLLKTMVIDNNVGEMRFYGDRGDGTIDRLATIGVSDYEGLLGVIGYFGNTNYQRVALVAANNSSIQETLRVSNGGGYSGIHAESSASATDCGAVRAIGSNGYGIHATGSGTNRGAALLQTFSTTAPVLRLSAGGTSGSALHGAHIVFEQAFTLEPALAVPRGMYLRNDCRLVGADVAGTTWRAYVRDDDISLTNYGDATAPGQSFFGDADTGGFRKAANVMAWATAGVERMSLASTGLSVVGTLDTTGNIASGANVTAAGNVVVTGNQLAVGTVQGQTFVNIRFNKDVTGAVTSYSELSDGVVQSGVTTAAYYSRTQPSTAAAAFTLANLICYSAGLGTIGAGSSVTNAFGFNAEPAFIPAATLVAGYRGGIPAATGRYNIYCDGDAQNLFTGVSTFVTSVIAPTVGPTLAQQHALPAVASSTLAVVGANNNFSASQTFGVNVQVAGQLAVGTVATAGSVNVRLNKNVAGATVAYSVLNDPEVQSAVTATAYGSRVVPSTAAAAFTLTTLNAFSASIGTVGAGSAVTNAYAFHAESGWVGAGTINAGFRGAIPSAAGRYNLYMDGTAQNLLAGVTTFSTNIVVGGTEFLLVGASTAKTAAATLTAAELLTQHVKYNGAAANLTLPLASALDSAILSGALPNDRGFELFITSATTSTGVATVATNTGWTLDGAMTVAIGASQRFLVRKTGTNAFTLIRT